MNDKIFEQLDALTFDDLLIVPGLVLLALRMIPKEVVAESREKVQMDK